MRFKNLPQKYQWLLIACVLLCFFVVYAKARLIPFYQEVAAQGKQLDIDRKLLKAPNIPEEPYEDSTFLAGELSELKKELAGVAGQAANLEQRLAPVDSQDVLLKISEVARSSRVKVVQNLPYLVQRRVMIDVQTGQPTNKKMSKAEERAQLKKLRQQAKRAKKNAAQFGGVVGAITREGELMDKMVNDFAEARPFQEVKIEGTFDNLKTFIQSMQAMPWQVTIVKLDIDVIQVQKAPQGLPQLLSAKMIVGM